MPAEARDVPVLMKELTQWINRELDKSSLPTPIIAALSHYQFATIHPYYDGNGRTARLITTLILHKAGYGLKGIYSLDEYYARNLAGYYDALMFGGSHNYYMGRARGDLTGFIAYFCGGMADAFSAVRSQAYAAANRGAKDKSFELRKLGPRERKLLLLFRKQGTATAAEIAKHLRISHRTTVGLCRGWAASGFLELQNASRKNRRYLLGAAYETLVDG